MKAIKYPFEFDIFGRAKTTTDSDEIYRQRFLTLLSTVVPNRPMNPNYGTDINRAIYENGGEAVGSVPTAIRTAVALYLPEVTILSIEITEPDVSGQLFIDILISLPSGLQTIVTTPYSTVDKYGVSTGDIV